MSDELQKFESGGRFGLMEPSWCIDDDGDGSIGAGGITRTYAFKTEEAREYFIQAWHARKDAKWARRELDSLKRALAGILTPKGRVRRNRLMELIEKSKR